MIEPGYVRKMAQYNAWQNRQLSVMLEPVPEADLRADRGAFFGSIFGTLNHLLWADTLWMSRFTDAVQPAQVGPEGQLDFTPTFPVWTAERFTLDGAIRLWADKMHAVDLAGTLTWSS
ncbi:MAG: DinB family protein, partial [Pseudomonadota bacterium]